MANDTIWHTTYLRRDIGDDYYKSQKKRTQEHYNMTTTEEPEEESSVASSAWFWIVMAVVLLALIGGAVFLFICCRKKKANENNKSTEKSTDQAAAPASTPKAAEESLDKGNDTAGTDIGGGTAGNDTKDLKKTTGGKDLGDTNTGGDAKDKKAAVPEAKVPSSLAVDPPKCIMPAKGGTANHKLNNTGTEKLVFKVETSNNADYRVTPVHGFVEPKGSCNIEVVRKAGVPQEDVMIVRCGPAPAGVTDAADAFGTIKEKSADKVKVPLIAKA